jgi:hypothetical protein
MPNIDLSILNQRQTPAFYADTLANRPAAGFIGRIFVSTNTYAFYRDNGTSWDLIGGPGTGTITGSGANGQVSYWNGASTITGSNDLFFDDVNGHLGIGTVTPGTALDVKHDQSTVVQLEQITATNDIRIAFINSGVGLWRLGAFYNAGANDFGVYDVVGAIQPVTIKKTTGQVLIGTSTVGSGKLVVASATSDNGIQIVGATAPSLRIDSAETAPTKRIGLGIATALNNFIQGAVDRDMTIFNGSTTASPILFGIYDTTNVQEAARISAARNFIVGKTTDSGERLQIQGTANFSSTVKAGSFDVPNGNYFRAQQSSGGTYQVALGYLVGTNDLLLNFSDNLRVKSLLGSDLLTIASSGAATFIGTGSFGNGNLNGAQFIIKGTNGAPPSSGTTTTALLRLSSGTGLYNVLDFGTNEANDYSWIQSTRANSLGTFDNLLIQPNGGKLVIGSLTAGSSKLSIVSGNDQAGIYMLNTYSNNAWSIRTGTYGVSNDGLGFYDETNGRTTLQLASTGNLLIGTTTDAGQKLQVNGTSLLNGIITSLPTYNNTTGIAANVQIDSNGFFARSTVSSLRYKENIIDSDIGLNVILSLKPKIFNYKKDYYDKADVKFLGLIAEEVAEICPYLADYENEDRTGQVENVRYANIVVPLIKAIQELNNKIENLKN